MYWKCRLSAILVLQIRHFRWLQFASLYARSRFIHIYDRTTSNNPWNEGDREVRILAYGATHLFL